MNRSTIRTRIPQGVRGSVRCPRTVACFVVALALCTLLPADARAQSCGGTLYTVDWDSISGPSGATSVTHTVGGGDVTFDLSPAGCYSTALTNASNTHGTGGRTLEWVAITSGCSSQQQVVQLAITFSHTGGVSGVSVPIIDVDWQGSTWNDRVRINATDGFSLYTPTSTGSSYSIANTNWVDYNTSQDYFYSSVNWNVGNNSGTGNVTVTFGQNVTQVLLWHQPNGEGRLGVGDVSFCVTNSLPVELTAFDARTDGGDVLLQWETASETNNAGFEIQGRTHDAPPEVWQSFGWVDGYGTTEQAQAYTYRLKGLDPGAYRFRLKQIDFDGTFEYHPEVEVAIAMAESFIIEPAYPNPFNPQTQFRFAVDRPQQVQVALYDMLGRRVKLLYEGHPPGEQMQTVHIDGTDLRSGLYMLHIVGETFSRAQTLTLLK